MKNVSKLKSAVNVFLLVISIGSVASAYLTPGQPPGRGGGRERPAPYPGDRPGGGGPGPGRPGQPPHRPPHHEPPYYPPSQPPYYPPPSNPYPGNPYPGNPYPGNPGYGQNIEINIYRSVYGNDRIDLDHYVDLLRYRGYVIDRVMVTASTRYSTGLISLLVNGFHVGQARFNGGYSQIATYYMNQHLVIGHGTNNLVLHTQGDMTIEHVTIVLR